MKKKIVYLLCELRLFKIAEKISPSLVGCWRGEKIAQGLKEAFERMTNTVASVTMGIEKFAEQIREIKTKDE